MALLNRSEFIARYGSIFEKMFVLNPTGEYSVRDLVNWELLEFPDLNLTGWTANPTTFQHLLDFIGAVVMPRRLVFTEIESIEKFTETWVVSAKLLDMQALWINSNSH
jgi:hypothetical protein